MLTCSLPLFVTPFFRRVLEYHIFSGISLYSIPQERLCFSSLHFARLNLAGSSSLKTVCLLGRFPRFVTRWAISVSSSASVVGVCTASVSTTSVVGVCTASVSTTSVVGVCTTSVVGVCSLSTTCVSSSEESESSNWVNRPFRGASSTASTASGTGVCTASGTGVCTAASSATSSTVGVAAAVTFSTSLVQGVRRVRMS